MKMYVIQYIKQGSPNNGQNLVVANQRNKYNVSNIKRTDKCKEIHTE